MIGLGTSEQLPFYNRIMEWSLYLLCCADGALYTGIATDVERRFAEHVSGRGAKSLRGRGPLKLVYQVHIGDRSSSLSIEHRIKKLDKPEKERLVREAPDFRELMKNFLI